MDVRPFTARATKAIRQCLDYVAANKDNHIGIEHLLLVLTAPDSDIAATKHSDLVDSCARVRDLVNEQVEPGDGDGSRTVPQTPEVKQLLLDSISIAKSLGHVGVNPEHLFLAILGLDSNPLVEQISVDSMIDINTMRKQLKSASELDRYTLPVPPSIDG